MTKNEKKLLQALKDILEWYRMAEAPVSLALQRMHNAEVVVMEVEAEAEHG